ncbi:hypothetical protein BCV70DRAFT_198232 [Testicularia cyperi]|uniref:Uncharacterized protein n=1 Tax=Testicularia cyperi TaxID=1882483 RepID=A0A317XVV1_9BASI|nr:hypothetical protein BCV70DRAFT_198232 [Testicularia cyperi]
MRTNIFVVLALVCATSSVLGGHNAWCLSGRKVDYQVTKDCCAATKEHGTTAFNELSHHCSDALGFGNGINSGRFFRCCRSRGRSADGN